MLPAITAIAHFALKVRDLETSLAFWRDTLGMAEMMRINHDDGSLMLVYLRITDTQYVELFPGGEGSRAPDRNAVAVNHVCLQTDDIAATADYLKQKGIALTVEPRMGLDGNMQAWFEDPDGNRIELMQMMPGNMQATAIERISETA